MAMLLCTLPADLANAWSQDHPLSEADGSLVGGGWLGTPMSSAGDLNGDGYGDAVLGATSSPGCADGAGRALIVLGGPVLWLMDTPIDEVDASYCGEHEDDDAYHVAGGGDINGDGYDDLVVGASGNDEVGTDGGQAYLVFGRTDGWEHDLSLALADASFHGESENDMAGRTVAFAGDTNGDGYDDILVGSPNAVDWNAGKVYLVHGRSAGWAMDDSLAFAEASFEGESGLDSAGTTLAGGGDVNGDGLDDFLIGAPFFSGFAGTHSGRVYLVLGRAEGWEQGVPLSEADVKFRGEHSGDWAGDGGASVAGDINGDGFDDIVIGVPFADTSTGKVYIALGASAPWNGTLSLGHADASLSGSIPHELVGFAPCTSGDVDGDGFDDILFGANWNQPDVYSGRAHLVLGRAGGWQQDMPITDAAASFLGESGESWAGRSNSMADLDDDGYDDLLISAPGNDWGEVYRINGAPCVDEDQDGHTDCEWDCDDHEPRAYPGGDETAICDDGIDNDCDGEVDEELDADGDGAISDFCDGDDCDPYDPFVYPGAKELICDGKDSDCDGQMAPGEVDEDGDGFMACEECDDGDPAVHPDADELCDDEIDNDCDGDVDAEDPDCAAPDDDDSADDDTVEDDDTTDPPPRRLRLPLPDRAGGSKQPGGGGARHARAAAPEEFRSRRVAAGDSSGLRSIQNVAMKASPRRVTGRPFLWQGTLPLLPLGARRTRHDRSDARAADRGRGPGWPRLHERR